MVVTKVVSANTRFGFKLFAQLVQQERNKNIFVSPSSIALALAMTYNGAGGETKAAMARALELQEIPLPEVNQANAQLKTILEHPDPKVQLDIANSLWARKGFQFNPEFLHTNQTFYKAEIAVLNFDDPKAPAQINDWVRRKTHDKIAQIVDSIDKSTLLFLINALYFKGVWTVAFDKAKTKEQAFTLANGTQKRHPLMPQSGRYNYYRGPNFQAVSLPYGGGRVSMYLFLPDTNSSLAEFYKSLSADAWEKWMREFRMREGHVELPRFKLEYEVTLNEALRALGMGVAFDPEHADFKRMITHAEKLFIGRVKHKTFVEVNEEGTEAAAVTSVEVRATSIMVDVDPPFRMVIDRPFFCAIRDNQTGTLLFMGAITEPK